MKHPYVKVNDREWLIKVQENGEDKELYIEFPPDALDQVGWDEGDTLLWEELPNGAWQLTKKEEDAGSDSD